MRRRSFGLTKDRAARISKRTQQMYMQAYSNQVNDSFIDTASKEGTEKLAKLVDYNEDNENELSS